MRFTILNWPTFIFRHQINVSIIFTSIFLGRNSPRPVAIIKFQIKYISTFPHPGLSHQIGDLMDGIDGDTSHIVCSDFCAVVVRLWFGFDTFWDQ